jgi:hypothetical protein
MASLKKDGSSLSKKTQMKDSPSILKWWRGIVPHVHLCTSGLWGYTFNGILPLSKGPLPLSITTIR